MISRQIEEAVMPICNSMSNLILAIEYLAELQLSLHYKTKGIVAKREAIVEKIEKLYHKEFALDQFIRESRELRDRWTGFFQRFEGNVGRGLDRLFGGRSMREFGEVIGRGGATRVTGIEIPSPAATQNVANITQNLASKQLEKGAKATTNMLGALVKSSVYAWIIEQLLEAIEGFFIVLKPFLPFVKITSAIIQSFFIPIIQSWIKYLSWAYKAYASNLYHAKKMGEQMVITGNQFDDLWKAMGTFDLPDLTYDWNKFSDDWNSAWSKFFAPLSSGFEDLFDWFEELFGWLETLVGLDFSTRIGGGNGGGGGGGGNPCDDPIYYVSHPECWGAQHGAYTGSYTGPMLVHPDEYIVPGEQMRGGAGRMEALEYNMRDAVDQLEQINKRNKRKDRFNRMRGRRR